MSNASQCLRSVLKFVGKRPQTYAQQLCALDLMRILRSQRENIASARVGENILALSRESKSKIKRLVDIYAFQIITLRDIVGRGIEADLLSNKQEG